VALRGVRCESIADALPSVGDGDGDGVGNDASTTRCCKYTAGVRDVDGNVSAVQYGVCS
jgi:hypothetical protein